MISKSAIAAAVAAALAIGAVAAPAFAQNRAQDGERLSITQIDQRLSGQGFRVVEIEWDDGKYEVTALNSQNQCRELDVNARSGEIMRDRADDDCHEGRNRAR